MPKKNRWKSKWKKKTHNISIRNKRVESISGKIFEKNNRTKTEYKCQEKNSWKKINEKKMSTRKNVDYISAKNYRKKNIYIYVKKHEKRKCRENGWKNKWNENS